MTTPKVTRVNPDTGKVEVAVLVSDRYDFGWSTWAKNDESRTRMLFSPELVNAILGGAKSDALVALAKTLFPSEYAKGAANLTVEWIEKGARFEVSEYEGYEHTRIFHPDDGDVA